MVHCGVTPPYPSPAHLAEGDDSSKGRGDCNALGGYTRRGRDINRIGAGAVAIDQSDDAVARYGKNKVVCEHVWCTTCQSEGHHRDKCPVLGNYVVTGAPSPFPTGPQT